jgi:hypothetical protein
MLHFSTCISLSVVLRAAFCHGGWGWQKERYEKWWRATLERPRPEGSRNSVKQIAFPHGYLTSRHPPATPRSLEISATATMIALT